MFSFLSSIFWIAVFCGGSYKLYTSIKAENIDMDLSDTKVKKWNEQTPFFFDLTTSEHLNNKTNASRIGLYTFIVVISLWGMESVLFKWAFLLPFFAFGVISLLHVFGVAADADRPKALGPDGKFNFALIPFCLCIILFFGSPQILPTPEASNQPQATSNQKAKKTKLDTRASSSEIEYIMEKEYVDKEQVQNWINRIGYKKLKLLVSQRNSCAGMPFRADCIGTDGVGEIEPTITSIEERIACADDYTNCTSVSKWSNGRADYKIREDCTEAVNKKAKKNVMRLYQFAEWPRVDKWNGATVTWYNYDAGYKCTYSLAEETISVSTI